MAGRGQVCKTCLVRSCVKGDSAGYGRYTGAMTIRVLFVCLGNICRSPTAEGVFRHILRDRPDLNVIVDSAGTSGWHVGEPPYGAMQQAALARGYDLSALRARQFVVADFDRFDLIIAMDDSNVKDIENLRPKGAGTSVVLFTDFAPEAGINHIPDPYYTRDFDQTITLVETASFGLLDALTSGHRQ